MTQNMLSKRVAFTIFQGPIEKLFGDIGTLIKYHYNNNNGKADYWACHTHYIPCWNVLSSKELQCQSVNWKVVQHEVVRTRESVSVIDDAQIQAKVNEYCDKIGVFLELTLKFHISNLT